MINCKQLSELSSDYLDGNLGLTEKLSIRFHILMCKYCRRFLSQLSMAAQFLPADDVEDISEAEIESQLNRLLASPDRPKRPG